MFNFLIPIYMFHFAVFIATLFSGGIRFKSRPETNYPELVSGFSQSHHTDVEIVPQIRKRQLFSPNPS
jgi:hypothetical protein